MSRAKVDNTELETLRANISSQIQRLFDQLEDLELLKDELTEQEYNDERQSTIGELQDFEAFLQNSLSLSTEFTVQQQAMKATLLSMQANNTATAENHQFFRLMAQTDANTRTNQQDQLINKFMELDLSTTASLENNKKMTELANTLSKQTQ